MSVSLSPHLRASLGRAAGRASDSLVPTLFRSPHPLPGASIPSVSAHAESRKFLSDPTNRRRSDSALRASSPRAEGVPERAVRPEVACSTKRRLRDAEALGSQADAHRRERARQPDLGGRLVLAHRAADRYRSRPLGRVFRLPHGDCPSLAVTEVGPVRVITGGHTKLAFPRCPRSAGDGGPRAPLLRPDGHALWGRDRQRAADAGRHRADAAGRPHSCFSDLRAS